MVLGIGNPLIADDRVGLKVIDEIEKCQDCKSDVVFKKAYTCSPDLLYEVETFKSLIVIDSLCTGLYSPGTIVESEIDIHSETEWIPTINGHVFPFQQLLQLGIKCGYQMPSRIKVIGIEGQEFNQFTETLTYAVEQSISKVVDRAKQCIEMFREEQACPPKK